MPTLLGTRYETNWTGWPPHMSQEDYGLWVKVRGQLLKEALAMYFDVGLGLGGEMPEQIDPDMARMWFRNTQKRADAVIEYPEHWLIVELRAQAQSSAIGRLLAYKKLWEDEPLDQKPVEIMLVSNRIDQDLLGVCAQMKISCLTV